ncbi:hypothetical protein [Nitratireductor luteus]|uniref:hypothetical protein n=1 Tax=Nitratireductor luteus TaxID=2976980 RepID=UPI00223EF00A|nr:hypothetical protein [Nitratireductor luteus]
MSGSTEAQVARLDERFNSLEKMLSSFTTEIRLELKSARDSRKAFHESHEATAKDILLISHRLETLEKEVTAIRPTSDEYLKMREQVRGAGTLGRWVWRIGIGVITVAGWIVGAYTYLTGRPPP